MRHVPELVAKKADVECRQVPELGGEGGDIVQIAEARLHLARVLFAVLLEPALVGVVLADRPRGRWRRLWRGGCLWRVHAPERIAENGGGNKREPKETYRNAPPWKKS